MHALGPHGAREIGREEPEHEGVDDCGAAGRYDAGKYDTYLFGRTHVAGETLTGFYHFNDTLTLTLEHGIPHGLSESRDCNYGAAHGCEHEFDAGVWQSFAGWGTVIQGHPCLDLLLVAWQIVPDDFFAAAVSGVLWDAVCPALVNGDPRFRGDEAAFCEAYGSNQYAPDLRN